LLSVKKQDCCHQK